MRKASARSAALDRLQSGRTTLVIAHQLATVRHATASSSWTAAAFIQSELLELLRADGLYASGEIAVCRPGVKSFRSRLS
jgi:ABC-type transport system involved in Fe-S cluster assembly fused permease/ATPase subunit